MLHTCLNKQNSLFLSIVPKSVVITAALVSFNQSALAWESEDGTVEARGFVENATYFRHERGLSKSRSTVQLELSKAFGSVGVFSDFAFHGTFRGSYDAVYQLNSDEFGDDAGSSLSFAAPANPFFLGGLPNPPPGTPAVLPFSTFPEFGGTANPGGTGAIGLAPVGLNGPVARDRRNEGLVFLGSDLHNNDDGGVVMAVPVRPCDEDQRGCIDGYLDFDEHELASPEFNDRLDFLREAYFTADIPLDNGAELGFSFGRQQVVWGRTDLFRVLDVINPVDFSRHNIYDELEDIRIPMGIFTAEYHTGGTETFEDLSFQFLWKWEKFRPHNLGQGGSPYAILGAGNFFRAMNNCWDNGCTVWNFPAPDVAVEFGPNQIGIRQADQPDWKIDETDVGMRMEGVFKGVGFSLNTLYYTSQLPSLRGGLQSVDPFSGVPGVYPYSLAFDIAFPRIFLLGGSTDFYSEKLKSAFRVEFAWTTGEEFPNTLRPELYSESNVIRWVVGWDRPTFIPFLNKNRSFLISAQLFGQHLLDHELEDGPFGKVGIPDWKNNVVGTLLFKGFYKNDQVSPQLLMAYDAKAQAGTVAPSIDWLISDSWRFVIAANLKFGTGAQSFDDNRSAIPYPSLAGLLGAPGTAASAGLSGYEPLGRFRAGPLGMAQNEDEIQLTLRYRF